MPQADGVSDISQVAMRIGVRIRPSDLGSLRSARLGSAGCAECAQFMLPVPHDPPAVVPLTGGLAGQGGTVSYERCRDALEHDEARGPGGLGNILTSAGRWARDTSAQLAYDYQPSPMASGLRGHDQGIRRVTVAVLPLSRRGEHGAGWDRIHKPPVAGSSPDPPHQTAVDEGFYGQDALSGRG